MKNGQKWGAMSLAMGAAAVLAPAATAQEAAPVNAGNVNVSLGLDATTEYIYRGIVQENQGIILQPHATISFGLLQEGNFTLDAYVGTWNSLHFNDAVSSYSGDQWFEGDLLAGVALGLPQYDLTVDLAYVYLGAPSFGGKFAEEVQLTVAYDDAELMESFGSPVALRPYALLALEVDGGSDAGPDEGLYLELGIEPTVQLLQSEDYPVALKVPVTVGLGLEDYYEDFDGNDDTFGFVDVGLVFSTPLAFIPSQYGAWEASVGAHYIHLGDSAAAISGPDGFDVTDGSRDRVYFTAGLSMTY